MWWEDKTWSNKGDMISSPSGSIFRRAANWCARARNRPILAHAGMLNTVYATAAAEFLFCSSSCNNHGRKERRFWRRWVHSNLVYTVTYLRTHITVLHPLATEFFMELETINEFDEFHAPPTGRHELFKCCMCATIYSAFFATCYLRCIQGRGSHLLRIRELA